MQGIWKKRNGDDFHQCPGLSNDRQTTMCTKRLSFIVALLVHNTMPLPANGTSRSGVGHASPAIAQHPPHTYSHMQACLSCSALSR